MSEDKRKQLVGLLIDLDMDEIHPQMNRFMDKKDVKKALAMSNVGEAINTLLNYLAK